jgi:hypothetical protein
MSSYLKVAVLWEKNGNWKPVHWAVLLGGKCSVADFRKLLIMGMT